MMEKAIIIDIDGTIANDKWRKHMLLESPRDWDKINNASINDTTNEWCVNLVDMYHRRGYKIIFLTARNTNVKELTVKWLTCNVPFSDYLLLMRPENDNITPDYQIKETIYRNEIEPAFDVEFCIDDRQTVVDMWRRNGLVALHCEGGTF